MLSSFFKAIGLLLLIQFNPGLSLGQQKPQVILLTDIGGDTDDEQSLVRFLYYADQFEIKAICATSRLGHGQDTRPELIIGHLEAYKSIYPNLLLHSKEYPRPEELLRVVKNGSGNSNDIGEGFDSEASQAIINIVDGSEDTIHIPVWGGLRELAQALWKVKKTRSEGELEQFCSKILVHAIGDQDGHRDYILKNFKTLKFIANGYAWYGFTGVVQLSSFRGMYMTGNQQMQDSEWVKTNIHGNGPLSDRYQLNGHGTNGMKEGDSPSFMGLIGNGLNVPEKPEWGGWGGRFRQLSPTLFIDAPDFMEGTLNERHGVARWRTAYQSDFMARAKWAILPFDQANHNPIVVVNEHTASTPLYIKAQPGKELELDAAASADPDGDSLTFSWWVYNEIFQPVVPIDFKGSATNSKLKIKMPPMAPGKQLHLILEVTDKGLPALTSYKRVIITSTI